MCYILYTIQIVHKSQLTTAIRTLSLTSNTKWSGLCGQLTTHGCAGKCAQFRLSGGCLALLFTFISCLRVHVVTCAKICIVVVRIWENKVATSIPTAEMHGATVKGYLRQRRQRTLSQGSLSWAWTEKNIAWSRFSYDSDCKVDPMWEGLAPGGGWLPVVGWLRCLSPTEIT